MAFMLCLVCVTFLHVAALLRVLERTKRLQLDHARLQQWQPSTFVRSLAVQVM